MAVPVGQVAPGSPVGLLGFPSYPPDQNPPKMFSPVYGAAPPVGWLTRIALWFGSSASMQRGQPAPLGPEEKRERAAMRDPKPFGAAMYRQTRRYDRGAQGYAYQGGILESDPIGAGVVFCQKLPIMPGATGTYVNGALAWNTTAQNFGQQPLLGPIYTPAQLAALYGANIAGAASGIVPMSNTMPSASPPVF